MTGGPNYSVGVTVYLIDKVSAGMHSVTNAMLQAGQHSQQFQQRLQTIQARIQGLQMVADVGKDMFRFAASSMNAMVEPAKKLEHATNIMRMQGQSQADVAENVKLAWKATGEVITTTAADNIKTLNELRLVMGGTTANMHHVREMMPTFAKMDPILTAAKEHYGISSTTDDLKYAMAKSLEMRGLQNDPKKFMEEMTLMAQVMTASGGKVLPTHYQNVIKYMRQGKQLVSENFMYNVLPELIAEMSGKGGAGGGGGPGAMIAAAMRIGLQGIMSKATAGNLMDLGLLGPGTVLKTTTTGTIVKSTGGVKDQALFATDMDKWVNTVFVTALKKKYGHGANKDLSDKEINMLIPQVFKGNQLAVALFQELYNKRHIFEKFREQREMVAHGSPTIDAMYKKSLADPANAEKALSAQFENLKTVFGQEVIPILIPGMHAFANAVHSVAAFFKDNPQASRAVVSLIAGIGIVGGAMAVVASVAIPFLIASVAGIPIALTTAAAWIAGGVLAVSAAIFAAFNWKWLGERIVELKTKIGQLVNNVVTGFNLVVVTIKSVLQTGWNTLAGAFAQGWGGFIAQIAALISNPMAWAAGQASSFMANWQKNLAEMGPKQIAKQTAKVHNYPGGVTINQHNTIHTGAKGDDVARALNRQAKNAVKQGIGRAASEASGSNGGHH